MSGVNQSQALVAMCFTYELFQPHVLDDKQFLLFSPQKLELMRIIKVQNCKNAGGSSQHHSKWRC